jgi:hypothetical protein
MLSSLPSPRGDSPPSLGWLAFGRLGAWYTGGRSTGRTYRGGCDGVAVPEGLGTDSSSISTSGTGLRLMDTVDILLSWDAG